MTTTQPTTEEGRPLPPVELAINRDRALRYLFLALVLVNLTFVLLDILVNYRGWADSGSIRRLFNLTREDAMASWFGVTQTTFAAVVVWLNFVTCRKRGAGRWRVVGWVVLALFFSYMAVDDGSSLHERVGSAFQDSAEGAEGTVAATALRSFPSYAWQVCFLPGFAALGVFTIVFLWGELGAWRPRALVAAALGCLVVAVCLDFIEGLDRGHPWNLYTLLVDRFGFESLPAGSYRSPFSALRHFSKAIEESLETFGITLFLVVFLRQWMTATGTLHVRFDTERP